MIIFMILQILFYHIKSNFTFIEMNIENNRDHFISLGAVRIVRVVELWLQLMSQIM